MNTIILLPNAPPHLVVADGHRRVQQVADVPLVLEALRLQLQPVAVRLLRRLVHQQPHLLNLGDCQGLRAKTPGRGKLSRASSFFYKGRRRWRRRRTDRISAVRPSRFCASSGRESSSPTGSFF